MQERYDRCPNCMQALQDKEDVCTNCGFDMVSYEERPNCLRPFTVLQNKYMLGRVIGVGGFGITYIGWDLNLQTYIAIKEYFPDSIASRDTSRSASDTQVIPNESKRDVYEKGLKRYVGEAQSLSKFYQLQGIVSVKDFFYENGTGYIVMEYINGINLKEFLKNSGGRLDEMTVLNLMKPVLESLYQIHNSGVIHRDISPDNIMVDSENRIKLIDFGSAKGQSNEGDKTFTVILKHGYAPSEQYYAKGNQGPWTDIYSLCATMYKMLTGNLPPNSIERMNNDEYMPPSACGVVVSPRTEAVLAKGLAVKASDRYQNLGEMINDLYGSTPVNMISPVTPMNNNPAFVNPMSMSQQSMHLSMQPVMSPANVSDDAKKRTKTGIIIGSVFAVVVILAVVLILVLGGKDDKDKDGKTSDTENASVSDHTGTDEPDTSGTDTTEPVVQDVKYEWPTELSDNWRDYQISIDGTVYALPIPITEWESKGWRADYMPTYVSGEGSEFVTFEKDGITVSTLLYNYGLNEAPVENCYIIGLKVYSEDIKAGKEVILPGNIKMDVATVDDIKKAYGAPEYIYEGSNYTSLDYAGDEYEDGMDLQVDTESGTLNQISLANTAIPDGVNISPSDITTDVPEINSQYVAPGGPSTDRFDNIISIDKVNYVLPVPVSVFIENGWTLDSATDAYISGNSSIWTYLEKGGNKIEVTIENFTPNAMVPPNGYVTKISAETKYCSYEVVFPGGIKLGDPVAVFLDVYGDMGEDLYTYEGEFGNSYSVWNYDMDNMGIYIDVYQDIETGILTQYNYSTSLYLDYFN